jgi:hypothetical protein
MEKVNSLTIPLATLDNTIKKAITVRGKLLTIHSKNL